MKKMLNVKGMHCKSCEMLLKDVIEEKGLKVLKADHVKGVIEVEASDPKLFGEAAKAIKAEGYEVVE